MRIFIVVIISLIFTQVDAGGCAQRWYPGKDSPVCVCNCTYCDEVEAIGPVGDQDIIVYTTTRDGKRLERSVKKKLTGLSSLNVNLIVSLDLSKTSQTMNGIGGTMTDSAAYNILSLKSATCGGGSSSATMKDVLMKAYFSSDGGLEYNMLRVPIASNDGSNRKYTYADTPGDFNLTTFSLQREDTDMKIPCINEAQSLAGDRTIRIICSSWSAPAWMKRCECLSQDNVINKDLLPLPPGTPNSTNYETWAKDYINSLLSVSDKNVTNDLLYGRMLKGDPLPPGSPNSEYYETWAKYLVKFLQAYKERNVSIWAITPQNEPRSSMVVPWQSQVLFAKTERDFLKNHLGPEVRKAGLDTKIFIFDDNRFPDLPAWVAEVCNAAGQYVDGIALHWYLDWITPAELLGAARKACGKEVEILYTEAGFFATFVLHVFGGVPAPSDVPTYGTWQLAADHAKAIALDLNFGSTGWIDWALCTDINGGPQWIGKTDSAVIVNASAGEFYKQPLYYVIGHFSKFIPRGSKRIELTLKVANVLALPLDVATKLLEIPAVAFVRPDGLKVVVTVNDHNQDLLASISVVAGQILGQTISLNIPPNSVTTTIFR